MIQKQKNSTVPTVEQMLDEIKEYKKFNPTEIFQIAEVADFTPQEVLYILEEPSPQVEYVTHLYYAMQAVRAEKQREALESIANKEMEKSRKM